jgi:hypothetical protein
LSHVEEDSFVNHNKEMKHNRITIIVLVLLIVTMMNHCIHAITFIDVHPNQNYTGQLSSVNDVIYFKIDVSQESFTNITHFLPSIESCTGSVDVFVLECSYSNYSTECNDTAYEPGHQYSDYQYIQRNFEHGQKDLTQFMCNDNGDADCHTDSKVVYYIAINSSDPFSPVNFKLHLITNENGMYINCVIVVVFINSVLLL